MSKTREAFPLSTKKIIKKTAGSAIAWVILYVLTIVVLFISLRTSTSVVPSFAYIAAGLGLFLIIIVTLTYLYNVWYFNVYFYDLTQDFIIIRKGPITPREITIPYERVQDVYVDQDIFDRIMGLYDVHLSSATFTSGMEAHIDGVEKTAADGLKNALLTTVKLKITRGKTDSIEIPKPPANI